MGKIKYQKPVSLDAGGIAAIQGARCSYGNSATPEGCFSGNVAFPGGCTSGTDPNMESVCDPMGTSATNNCKEGSSAQEGCSVGSLAGWGCFTGSGK